MTKKVINKEAQEKFLQLKLIEQIELLNNIIGTSGSTDAINKNLGFSYGWVLKKMEEQGAYYVASIRKFVIAEKNNGLSDEEVAELKAIIKDYKEFKENTIAKTCDIRFCAGTCGEESITRSVVVDKNINENWNYFCKKNNFINNKDLVTVAFKEFMDKYS